MSSGEQKQAERALIRLARKRPLIALAVLAVLVAGAALGWFGVAGGGNGSATEAAGRADQTAAAAAVADSSFQEAEVARVVDGDTLKVNVPGAADATVRLVGIDTPESVAQDEARNCEEGVIASDYTKSLVAPGRKVWLSRDVSDTDRYGRLLRYVWLERPSASPSEDEIASKMLNAILVREGYAQVKRYKPDTTLLDLFQRWGDEAAAAGKGVTRKWA